MKVEKLTVADLELDAKQFYEKNKIVKIKVTNVIIPFSHGPSYLMGQVYKWNWTVCVCPSVITSKMIIISDRRLHRPL